MTLHKDKEANQALIRLLDALCEFERYSGRRSTLFLIPDQPDENIVIAQDGKPLPTQTYVEVERIFAITMNSHYFKEKLTRVIEVKQRGPLGGTS